MVILVEDRIQRGQSFIIAKPAVLFCDLELRLPVEVSGNQPKIGRIEFQTGIFQGVQQFSNIQRDGERLAGGSHFGKIVELLRPVPRGEIQRSEYGICHTQTFFRNRP